MPFVLLFLQIAITWQPHKNISPADPFIIILGVAQDAGYPHAGCQKACCVRAWDDASKKRFATSLALVDPQSKKWWLFEATPDITEQLQLFRELTRQQYPLVPEGIFLTHAHIGHYTGLMYFGREAMNTKELPVYAMPRMKTFLGSNGPWSQLVNLKNISIIDLENDSAKQLVPGISITPFLVPHRDEFTETVGFIIACNEHKSIFIPDIDKWSRFDRNINSLVHQSNLALLDGTFYKDGELPGRAMSEIPHPFIEESMQQFNPLASDDKKKVRFIHFNHTNPLLNDDSEEYRSVNESGYGIARQGETMELR